jgi:hypothetical protein
LSISVRLKEPHKRRPRPDMGWSAIEEEEEEGTNNSNYLFKPRV